ncbi:unannotated protein [freshwater metagenome]|uniref:Unannotated protein n=1 Tax=freshwater metagenome TaxID=449393 RepID=A0A6J6GY64_9ZZZZ
MALTREIPPWTPVLLLLTLVCPRPWSMNSPLKVSSNHSPSSKQPSQMRCLAVTPSAAAARDLARLLLSPFPSWHVLQQAASNVSHMHLVHWYSFLHANLQTRYAMFSHHLPSVSVCAPQPCTAVLAIQNKSKQCVMALTLLLLAQVVSSTSWNQVMLILMPLK